MASSSAAAGGGDDWEVPLKKGQRQPTPSPGAGQRVFYESLFRENTESAMALIYGIEYGIFSADEAERLYPRYEKIKKGGKVGAIGGAGSAPTPVKAAPARKSAGAGKVVDLSGVADMAAGGSEGIGTMGMGL